MKLIIYNKNNLIDSTLPIATRYQENNLRVFEVDENAIITENYNETLDSANIRISHLTTRIDIEPYDKVKLYEIPNIEAKYFCVDTYTMKEETLNQNGYNEKFYSYDISLFSETKLLENVILPNLSITKKTSNPLTVYQYIEKYMNLYSSKIRVNNTFVNEISLSDDIYNFYFTECPEFQWNAPTLREVITDLMMVDDCIPIVRNGVLDYIDLTEVKSDIPSYNYIQWSQSSDDYVSDLKMNLQNVMQTSVSNVKTTTTTTEYIPITTDGYVLTDANMNIQTQFPILNIKHLWYCFPFNNGDTTSVGSSTDYSKFIKVDLCNMTNLWGGNLKASMVYEYKEYQTLPAIYSVDYIPNAISTRQANDITNFYSKKRPFNLYFTRGNTKIEGFSELIKTKIGTSTPIDHYCWEYLRCLAVRESGYSETEALTTGTGTNLKLYPMHFFQIEYETMADAVFQAGKSDYGANRKVVVDNQTNSWVDAYNQGNLEYQKANRLGNKAILINQRATDSNLIQIGQTHYDSINNETYIVYQTQYQIHSTHTEVNALAVENYVLKDYFTGINSKIRTWANATDEALIRHDLDKYYCEFSFNNHSEYNNAIDNHTANRYLSPMWSSHTDKPIKYALVNTKTQVGQSEIKIPSVEPITDTINALGIYTGTTHITTTITREILRNKTIISCGVGLITTVPTGYESYINATASADSTTGVITVDFVFDHDTPSELRRAIAIINTVYEENTKYSLNTINRLVGNSIIHTFGFNDNSIVNKAIDTDVITTSDILGSSEDETSHYQPLLSKDLTLYGGVPLKDYYYCDKSTNYGYDKINVSLYDGLDIMEGYATMPSPNGNFEYKNNSDSAINFTEKMFKHPLLTTDAFISKTSYFSKEYTLYKDNREIPKISVQFELCSDTRDIYFTKSYIEHEVDVFNGTFPTLHVYIGNTYEYGATSKTGLTQAGTISVSGKTLTISGVDMSNKAVYIGTSTNDIWFGAKAKANTGSTLNIYLNVLKDRRKYVYNDNGIIIGEI